MITSIQPNCSNNNKNNNLNINKIIDNYLNKYDCNDILVKKDKLDTSLSSSFINFTNMNTIYEENILNINTNSSTPDSFSYSHHINSSNQQTPIISISSSSSQSSPSSILLTPDSLIESEIENCNQAKDDTKLENKVN